jgi:antirestriction protein ArdC
MATTIDKENRSKKLEAAKDVLATEVAKLQSEEGWQRMLKALAGAGKFGLRRLSFRNQLLVLGQRPSASQVATYGAWQTAGRQVQKGEKALTILAPILVKKEKAEGDVEAAERVLAGFRPHAVFDVGQTAPIPGRVVEAAPDIGEFVRNIEDDAGFGLAIETLREFALGALKGEVSGIELRQRGSGDDAEAHGWFSPLTRNIVVVTGETSRPMQIKTLVHELAHAILHGAGSGHDRAEGEVEAESVAFLVCQILGIDSGCYSFGYVGSWADGENADKLILKSGQRIVGAANKILDAFEAVDGRAEVDLQEAA